MNQIDKVIEVAKSEVGYVEKATNKNLDSKTANAGSGNYTKYARDLDAIKGFYNGNKNGYPWCDVFVDWCFVQAFGVEEALRLLCSSMGSCGAGCGYSASYYKNKGQFYNTPKAGDQIFFGSANDVSHTGLVYKVDSNKVYTIEGNTSGGNDVVVANGGCVAYKSYTIGSSKIYGYGRPNYSTTASKAVETAKTADAKRYYLISEVAYTPYRNTLNKLIEKGVLAGKGGTGENRIIDLSEDAVRLLVMLDTAGLFD